MAAKTNFEVKLSAQGGINQDPSTARSTELADCLNVILEGGSLVVRRKSLKRISLDTGIRGLASITWPDKHNSLVAVTNTGVFSVEARRARSIAGDIDIQGYDRVNLATVSAGNYLVGAPADGGRPWKWDGNIDRPITWLNDLEDEYAQVAEFEGHLIGISDDMSAYYSDYRSLKIRPGNYVYFSGGHGSMKLMAFRVWNKHRAVFWGKRGLWILYFTGEIPEFRQQLISHDVTISDPRSIVEFPDGSGYAWKSEAGFWALTDSRGLYRIDISNDSRRANRLGMILARTRREPCIGTWHWKRGVAMWTLSRKKGTDEAPFDEPVQILWDPQTDRFWIWELNHDVMVGTSIWEYGELKTLVGTQDGKIMELEGTDQRGCAWMADFELRLEGAGQAKYKKSIVESPAAGAPFKLSFWTDCDSEELYEMVDPADAYDRGQIPQPDYDPGGPGDRGMPPHLPISIQVNLGVTGHNLILRAQGAEGPTVPFRTLTVTGLRTR